jgi:hypothetical protein
VPIIASRDVERHAREYAMTLLRVSDSGQVYNVDLDEVRITPDAGGGFYVHGKGHFDYFERLDDAEGRKKELDHRAFHS